MRWIAMLLGRGGGGLARAGRQQRFSAAVPAPRLPPQDPPKRYLEWGPTRLRLPYTVETPPLGAEEEEETKRATVVCLHGAPGSVFDWRYLSPALTEQGFNVVRLELPGHAESPRALLGQTETQPDGAAFAAFIEDVLRRLGQENVLGSLPPILAAHSLGTEAALALAAQSGRNGHITIGGIALLCPIGLRPHRGLSHGTKQNLARKILPAIKSTPAWFNKFVLAPLAWVFSVMVFGFPARNQAGEYLWMCHRAALLDFARLRGYYVAVGSGNVPVRLFYGNADPLIEPEIHSEALALWESSEVAAGVFFQGGTHFTLKSHADEIAAEMASSLMPQRSQHE